ncbi:MAG: molybdopterin oxidoreductase family protein [Thermomicrobiales bacterium]|nr:molybdopterin oxidoreductase family protein [Thermomicrobiales bacterium]
MSTSNRLIVRGACAHDCPDGCSFISEVENGKVVDFYANPDHPITQGWLCAKVRPYLDRVYAPDRLQYPMRRVGPKGGNQWERIAWDEAIDEIAQRWTEIIDQYGGAAILPYSFSGTLGMVENMAASNRLWNRIGASGLERTICDAAATAACKHTLGGKPGMDPREVRESDLLLIWGHNPSSTSPHFVPLMREAQRNGTFVVVIDPRRTRSARAADLHIQPNPSTDAALALGLIDLIFAAGRHNEPWLETHTVGWRALRERAAEYPVERVAQITGLDETVIVELAERWMNATTPLVKFNDGIQRSQNGGQTIRAILALPAVTGHYGKRGAGAFYSESSVVVWNGEALGKFSECPPQPRIVNMNRLGAALTGEITDPPIKALYVFIANPVTSTPNAPKVIQGLLRDDLFTVVHEQFMTDTARFADIVLPATSQLEVDDVVKPSGHRHIHFNKAAMQPLGEARGNWDVQRQIARKMGFTEAWFDQTNIEVAREVFDATRRTNPWLSGIEFDDLVAKGWVPYTEPDETSTFNWPNLNFGTPSGKIELYCESMIPLGVDPLPDYVVPIEMVDRKTDELVLVSAAAHHFVSSSFANQPALRHKEGTPALEIHPTDAANRNIATGDELLVENDRGWCLLRANVTEDVIPGCAVTTKGYWSQGSLAGRNVNWLTTDVLSDLGNQASFHSNLVRVRKLSPEEFEARLADNGVELALTPA